MKRIVFSLFFIPLVFITVSGCAPLIIGGAVGALGGYVISKDTVQAETDIEYEDLWQAAINITRGRGFTKIEDYARGNLTAEMESSKVWIRLIKLTRKTTHLRIKARKYHLPNLSLAQDLFVRIMEEARR